MDKATKKRIEAGKAAQDAMEFAAAEFLTGNKEHFWRRIAELASKKIGCKLVDNGSSQAPMSREEALAFEREDVPMDRYKGKTVLDVPIWYWLRITEGDFSKRLERYVASQRFSERQDIE